MTNIKHLQNAIKQAVSTANVKVAPKGSGDQHQAYFVPERLSAVTCLIRDGDVCEVAHDFCVSEVGAALEDADYPDWPRAIAAATLLQHLEVRKARRYVEGPYGLELVDEDAA